MSALPIYRPQIQPEWIDYNGHVRDAYYGLIFSHAIDGLMDLLGIDEPYRQASRNTLYSLEMHTYFLREVKQDDEIHVLTGIIAADSKRLHVATALHCARLAEAAATAEFMLLHVHQGETVRSAPFPSTVQSRVDEYVRITARHPALGAPSRRIGLK